MKNTLCFLCLVPLFPLFQSSLAQTSTNPAATKPKTTSPRKVDVNEFEKLFQAKTNIVLDVRSPKEFAAGHIPGAVNADVNSPDFMQKVSTLDKSKLYLVHCAAGVRSARACSKLNALGFENLVDLPPGFRAWEKAGKPVEK